MGSAGLLAGCRVDLPVHAAPYINGKNALVFTAAAAAYAVSGQPRLPA